MYLLHCPGLPAQDAPFSGDPMVTPASAQHQPRPGIIAFIVLIIASVRSHPLSSAARVKYAATLQLINNRSLEITKNKSGV